MQTAVSSAGMYLTVHPVSLPGRDKSFMGLEGEVEIWHESRLWGWVGGVHSGKGNSEGKDPG